METDDVHCILKTVPVEYSQDTGNVASSLGLEEDCNTCNFIKNEPVNFSNDPENVSNLKAEYLMKTVPGELSDDIVDPENHASRIKIERECNKFMENAFEATCSDGHCVYDGKNGHPYDHVNVSIKLERKFEPYLDTGDNGAQIGKFDDLMWKETEAASELEEKPIIAQAQIGYLPESETVSILTKIF
jgi:hypothetical protein